MELLLPTCVAAATVSPVCSPVTTSYLSQMQIPSCFFFFKMTIVLFCSCGALHL